MNKRWRVEVEITYNSITVGLVEESKSQALGRVKCVLDRMLDSEVEISHYHILRQPEKCVEFD